MTPDEEPWWAYPLLVCLYTPVIVFTRIERRLRRWIG